MSFPTNCSDLPNPFTPLAFHPQAAATGIEVGRYVTVTTAGALLWDVLSNIFSKYDILFNHRLTFTTLVYAMARLSTVLFVLLSAVFQTAPVKHCTIFQQVRMATVVATISTTTLLFHIRLRGIYQMHRYIIGAFFIIWLCVVAVRRGWCCDMPVRRDRREPRTYGLLHRRSIKAICNAGYLCTYLLRHPSIHRHIVSAVSKYPPRGYRESPNEEFFFQGNTFLPSLPLRSGMGSCSTPSLFLAVCYWCYYTTLRRCP